MIVYVFRRGGGFFCLECGFVRQVLSLATVITDKHASILLLRLGTAHPSRDDLARLYRAYYINPDSTLQVTHSL